MESKVVEIELEGCEIMEFVLNMHYLFYFNFKKVEKGEILF